MLKEHPNDLQVSNLRCAMQCRPFMVVLGACICAMLEKREKFSDVHIAMQDVMLSS